MTSINSWEPFKMSYPTKEQLQDWFNNTDNNIGLVTGRISAIFAIDIDSQKAYEYYIQKINSLSDQQIIQSNRRHNENKNRIWQYEYNIWI